MDLLSASGSRREGMALVIGGLSAGGREYKGVRETILSGIR